MYLKKLNIIGFKTFPDETDILFDPGYTAVVGPNGSGKSNILDAVKWVLGEKSAKMLRGEKMEDVIFHGSESRKQSGFAEVSLHFDNSGKTLNLEFPVVKITRRLYADLTNEYFLNDSKVLRKDIEKALMDTGIGKSSYSIMEQGRVDAILHAKPEDRRAIFDEAAGISKYKNERQEVLKKLQYTQQNLLRITDVMSSMQKEMNLKEKQAERAREYNSLKSELDEIDKNLRYLKLTGFKNKLNKSETELEEVKKRNQELIERLDRENQIIQTQEIKKYEMEKRISEMDKKVMDYISEEKILREKIDKNKSFIANCDQRIDEHLKDLEFETIRLESITTEYERLSGISKEFEISIVDTEQNVEILISEKAEAERTIDENLKKIQIAQGNINRNESEHSRLRENLKEIVVSLIDQIEERKKEVEKSELERSELKENILNTLDDYSFRLENVLGRYILEHDIDKISSLLSDFNLRSLQEKLITLLSYEDIFRNILLDKDGMLAQKNTIDNKIEELKIENETLSNIIKDSVEANEGLRKLLDEKKESIQDLEKKILEMETKRNACLDSMQKNLKDREELDVKILSIKNSIEGVKTKKNEYVQELQLIEAQIESSYTNFLDMRESLDKEKEELKDIFTEIQRLRASSQKDQEDFKNLIPLLTEHERRVSGLKVQLNSISEEIYNDFAMTENELEAEKSNLSLVQSKEEAKLREIKSKIQLLGSVNPMAIDEFQRLKEIFEHHKNQKDDIEASKKDIEEVLRQINIESEKIFNETFEVIKNNFQDTFSTLFSGGKATIELTDKNDSLSSGIEIMAEPPGKHVQNLKLLSGGEKSLTVIALLFAIYMVRPSPFCFLDEIDAALDETNKLRFCHIIDKFKSSSQFIVITHAPSTISKANTIFGITNEEPGISKIVSLKMEEAKRLAQDIQKAV
ncbi:MAG: AAA family ATPase [Leptospiraceae bacterium]|nr:AAA family ATPase [Leptospiraceae bacterium]